MLVSGPDVWVVRLRPPQPRCPFKDERNMGLVEGQEATSRLTRLLTILTGVYPTVHENFNGQFVKRQLKCLEKN